jgi:hypothetical protein
VSAVVSPHLAAGGAVWVDGPDTGSWISERLGRFGPSVGHAVPLGYPAYAIVPLPRDEGAQDDRAPATVDHLLDVVEPFTGDQLVHSAIWDGGPVWYPTGTDPRETVQISPFWTEGERPTQQELSRMRAVGIDTAVGELVECPDTRPLELPFRRDYVWSGPLRSVLALRHHDYAPPSLIWPQDRAWFLGAPIDTDEIAVAAPVPLADAVLAEPHLNARRATPDDSLRGDD